MSSREPGRSSCGRRRRPAAAAFIASLALAGCVVAPVPPAGVVYTDPGAAIVAPLAPPPLIVEPMLVAPGPGYIWIGGYWSWSGGHHVWTHGRWAAPPRHGQQWVPRRWERGPGGWHQRGGHWR
ncbi:YXWGXW repeat-containing protein [Ramlibacter sp.]|uniref:YXWGXW repeat-containing protein n=1 Tax=Ramlibacter sp. TaxID=1917967 RepID=UPI002C67B0E2|nr:YXWGXW repeat-containing protein [Ramlibacter sp.]HWI84257.1 YXWGXW repeat-containing protein [Ramlibacter sp.]